MIFRMSDSMGPAIALQRALDKALQSDWFGTSTTSAGTYPSINIFRKGEDFLIVAELAGVDRDTLDVQVKGRQVRITGKKPADRREEASMHRRERMYGEFDRTLTIPAEIDAEGVKAEFRDGTLAVALPRAEKHKPRSIEIR